jgi:mRNA (guanine-N7-)-methyltransferase
MASSSSSSSSSSSAAAAAHAPPPPWTTVVSQKTGKVYYYNPLTKESSYVFPAPPAAAGAAAAAAAATEAPLPEGWARLVSSSTGKAYYFNSSTGVSSYDPPPPAAGHKRPRSNDAPAAAAAPPPPPPQPQQQQPPPPPPRPRADDGSAVLAQAVGEAYNRIEEQGREERGASPILHFRNFQNFIKASLFQAFAPQPAPRVLDLCCGRLADLLTKLRAKRVQRYCGVDIAGESLELGVRRLGEARARMGPLGVKLACADVGATDLGAAGVLAPGECFDLITVQFALHYFFSTEARALAFFANIAGRLAPGGVFLGTTTDADVLVRRLREAAAGAAARGGGTGSSGQGAAAAAAAAAAARTFGNSLYRVRFSERAAAAVGAGAGEGALGGSPYGAEYDFWLSERVEKEASEGAGGEAGGVPEYLVPWPLLERLARAIGLEPLVSDNFHAFYARSAGTGEGRELLQRMKVFDCEGTMSREEWEVAGLYRVFAFRRASEASSSSSSSGSGGGSGAGGSSLPPNERIFTAALQKSVPAALSPLAYSERITVGDIQNLL